MKVQEIFQDTLNWFLMCIRNLRKVTISFVMSVCLTLHMEQLGSHQTHFHKIWNLFTLRKFLLTKLKIY